VNARELKMSPADLVREQARQLAARKQHDKRVSVKAAPRVKAKAQRKQTKREQRAAVRAAVVARAEGRCERILGEPGNVMGRCNAPGVEMDHMHGRAREESVESCWLHCVLCARAKTTNRPSRGYWLWNFGIHAAGYGYAGQVAKVEALLAIETAQHGRAA
jgi:hypothetical protein